VLSPEYSNAGKKEGDPEGSTTGTSRIPKRRGVPSHARIRNNTFSGLVRGGEKYSESPWCHHAFNYSFPGKGL
jgi:hypothetical protein